MQSCRIEIRSVGPYKCMHLRINVDSIKEFHVAQRRVQFTCKNRLEIYRLLRTVVEAKT